MGRLRNLDWANMASTLSFAIIGLGFLALYLGWNGAANRACVDCQLPYLLSGGAVGLGLIATGIGVLVVQTSKRNRMELESKLDQVIDALESGGAGRPAAIRGAAPKLTKGAVLAGPTTFHAPDCNLAAGRDVEVLPRREAVSRGLDACRVCDP